MGAIKTNNNNNNHKHKMEWPLWKTGLKQLKIENN